MRISALCSRWGQWRRPVHNLGAISLIPVRSPALRGRACQQNRDPASDQARHGSPVLAAMASHQPGGSASAAGSTIHVLPGLWSQAAG